MPWVKKVRKPHECPPPRRPKAKYWTGSWWECICGQFWLVTSVREGMDDEYRWEKI